jgi:hypothetical protein
MHVQEMTRTHPHVRGAANDALLRCIEQCFDCAQVCIVCADACLGENKIELLKQCIRLNQDCADLCAATGKLASRRTGSNEAVLRRTIELCAEICGTCAEECARHADKHEHCRVCADVCRSCHAACRDAALTITSRH